MKMFLAESIADPRAEVSIHSCRGLYGSNPQLPRIIDLNCVAIVRINIILFVLANYTNCKIRLCPRLIHSS